jgi:hypothetical protein
VYLCVPIIDRIRFSEECQNHAVPVFLLQAALACAIPHVSQEALELGFTQYPTAQKFFFTRAKLPWIYTRGENYFCRQFIHLIVVDTSRIMINSSYRFFLSMEGHRMMMEEHNMMMDLEYLDIELR